MRYFTFLFLLFLFTSCATYSNDEAIIETTAETKNSEVKSELKNEKIDEKKLKEMEVIKNYEGSGHVFEGDPILVEKNVFPEGNREASVGYITAIDGVKVDLPAKTNYLNEEFPLARDLYNPYGTIFQESKVATISYENKDATVIDEDGEVITAYILANNYFELYINGVPVAKDPVPYTEYNSSIVKFKVKRPFNVAIKAVDWSEYIALGREENKGKKFAASEGGIVFVFKSDLENIIGISDDSYRVQTFTCGPIDDIKKFVEVGGLRSATLLNDMEIYDSKTGYGINWDEPKDVYLPEFNDHQWLNAREFSIEEVNIDEVPAYSNFSDIFDDPENDAKIIWTNNLYLDNEIIIRGIVQ